MSDQSKLEQFLRYLLSKSFGLKELPPTTPQLQFSPLRLVST